ncbi:MAG: 50S ribosomal protein L9 [Bacteroidetes bacterium GWF2_43_63]|nr:MAG: 50S ribosomal protein L9 [Bacteroidetes bacterium GWE2_42_42]OFY54880.1 MAG: 50S ribosomal protein L9 [Bacteroidetes bacterium GWF2_43_63]HCB63213.1 50S ribosomal protein L9 [Bacteroidales bacterium]HCY22182.1 50S ribosomal protein L9 [Bacteroidales bacterium]
MEVILTQDVKNLGYKDDCVKVRPGYGRNFLIPRGMAIIATESARKVLAENLKQRAFKEDKIRKEAEALAEKLKDVKLVIKTKAAATGKIYGSVNNIQVAEALKEQHNFDVDRKKIEVANDTIKETGTYTAKVNLYKDIKAEITIEVVGEE